MSTDHLCPACESGNHDHHVTEWNLSPGVIGGSRCPCPGGCKPSTAILGLFAANSGCTCPGHGMPGVRHMVPCCDKPHIDERWGPSDEDIVRMRMSDILHRTANAVHGGPLENGWWSWHDLPELADGLYQAVKRVREKHADDGTGHCKTCGDNYGSQKYPCQTMRALLGVE